MRLSQGVATHDNFGVVKQVDVESLVGQLDLSETSSSATSNSKSCCARRTDGSKKITPGWNPNCTISRTELNGVVCHEHPIFSLDNLYINPSIGPDPSGLRG